MKAHEIVDALNRGIVTRDDGTLACPVCDETMRLRQSYGPHWRRAHFNALSRTRQLEVDGCELCETCDLVVLNLTSHRRDSAAHRKALRTQRTADVAQTSTALERVEHSESSNGDSEPITAVDAGLAILAGLRPGSRLRVELLPDVVDWLRETERVVELLEGGKR